MEPSRGNEQAGGPDVSKLHQLLVAAESEIAQELQEAVEPEEGGDVEEEDFDATDENKLGDDHEEWSIVHGKGRAVQYRCDICGKMFGTRGNLLRHMPNHWEKKPYECADCGRTFPRRGQLMQHIRSHLNDFPFQCPTCSKSFKWKQSLQRHHCTREAAIARGTTPAAIADLVTQGHTPFSKYTTVLSDQ